uniref:ubiquitin-conjugating enzyme E2 U n=1 Tax=Jaculus jaculus TaxID=51337 RepID=UPI001E1AFDCA|nr:ubiquitin-conjugating enzyme E2 U [Jaculus jaculus]
MHCRAHSLLQRDLKELYHSTCKGITAKPVSEDMMKWEAEIEGLQDSIWNGVTFQLTIDFTPEYNLAPPVVKFTTIPFHPNVDPHSGLPSIDFLENRDKWNTSYTLSSILLSLQVLLSNPSLEKPVNLEAAQILMKDEPTYRMIIEKLFKEHLKMVRLPSDIGRVLSLPASVPLEIEHYPFHLGRGLTCPTGGGMSAMPKLYEKPHKLTRAIKTISFNDYYKTWSGIATSQATDQSRAPLLEDPHFMGKYYKLKKHELQNLKEWKIK